MALPDLVHSSFDRTLPASRSATTLSASITNRARRHDESEMKFAGAVIIFNRQQRQITPERLRGVDGKGHANAEINFGASCLGPADHRAAHFERQVLRTGYRDRCHPGCRCSSTARRRMRPTAPKLTISTTSAYCPAPLPAVTITAVAPFLPKFPSPQRRFSFYTMNAPCT